MKLTKKQLKEISKVEKKVSDVCDNNHVVDELTGITYPVKTTQVTLNEKLDLAGGELLKNTLIKPNQLEITLSFGYDSPSLKNQIKQQGFTVDKKIIKKSEYIKNQILFLDSIGILKQKQTYKAFERLNDFLSQHIADSYCDENNTAIRVK
jgi:hypothetical protein